MKQSFKAVINDVIIQPTKIQPIIVNFQNGELKTEDTNKMSCGLFHDQKKDKTVLALSNGEIVYKGYKPDHDKELMRTMLVLHNKKTGKVRLIEAERWQVGPVLQEYVIETNKNDDDNKTATLNKQFGSKKAKRRTEQYEKMKVNVDFVKEQLEKTVSNIEIEKTDLSIQLPADEYITNTILPTCNRSATNVKDVYNVYDIIPESKLETLYEQAMEILSGEIEGRPQFFTRILSTIQSNPDNIQKVALLLYIEAISKWFSMPMKDARKRDVIICPFSEEVNRHIINTYSISSGSSGRLRPNTMKDKGAIHSLIISLMLTNFALDIELFKTIIGVRIGIKKMTDLAKIVGAVLDKNDKKTFILKIPLPAPVSIIKKGKKQGKSI